MRRKLPSPTLIRVRAVSAYLITIRPILADCVPTRTEWARRFGAATENLRRAQTATSQREIVLLSQEYSNLFRALLNRLSRVHHPEEVATCHAELTNWLRELVASTEVFMSPGAVADRTNFTRMHERLAESRTHGRRFNAEYHRLIAEVKQYVESTRRSLANQSRSKRV